MEKVPSSKVIRLRFAIPTLVTLIGALLALTYFVVVPALPEHWLIIAGSDQNSARWVAFIIPTAFSLGLAIATIDALITGGWIFKIIGWFFSHGFPRFANSLKKLREWHIPENEPDLIAKYEEDVEGDKKDLEDKYSFSKWMIAEIIPNYENNVQGFAYGGAALLIFIVGLRGLNYITKEEPLWIIIGLALEFCLICLLGTLIFFKPEDRPHKRTRPNGGGGPGEPNAAAQRFLVGLTKEELTSLRSDLESVGARIKGIERKIEKLETLVPPSK
jgi:hypothetical protein